MQAAASAEPRLVLHPPPLQSQISGDIARAFAMPTDSDSRTHLLRDLQWLPIELCCGVTLRMSLLERALT